MLCDRHEYTLHITDSAIGRPVVLEEFPSIKIVYKASRNSLCPSQYGRDLRCFWEGDLSVTLQVNDHEITLNDHDERNKHTNTVGLYDFTGIRTRIDNQSVSETYLVFSVCKRPGDKSGLLLPIELERRRLGQPFLMEFNEVAGNGYTWALHLPCDMVIQLANTYAGECGSCRGDGNDEAEQDPGCSVIHSFVLKGVKRGRASISAIYKRQWQETESLDKRVQDYVIEIV